MRRCWTMSVWQMEAIMVKTSSLAESLHTRLSKALVWCLVSSLWTHSSVISCTEILLSFWEENGTETIFLLDNAHIIHFQFQISIKVIKMTFIFFYSCTSLCAWSLVFNNLCWMWMHACVVIIFRVTANFWPAAVFRHRQQRQQSLQNSKVQQQTLLRQWACHHKAITITFHIIITSCL